VKVYTRTGDQGKTGLLNGERVGKNHIRIKAYGEVDELNAVIGTVVASLPETIDAVAVGLRTIQEELFQIGARLAATARSGIVDGLAPISDDSVQGLEVQIDRMSAVLPELNSFILPGGHLAGAQAQVARTVCRRAERALLDLASAEGKDETPVDMLAYMNRLSDYFFVLARFINHKTGYGDAVQNR
jgi:cob(I)alamin adenosyltransferase